MKEELTNTSSITYPSFKTYPGDAEKIVSEGIQEVEKKIATNSQHENPSIRIIAEHALKSGGKRIRSRFVLTSYLVFNDGLSGDAINVASAAELFHTATLLHDDVMDQASLRRGKETVNSKWDSRTALLLGDFLLARAFWLLREVGSMNIIQAFIETAQELGEGALTEHIHKDDLNLNEEIYFYIIRRKTASFFKTCAGVGAILSKADQKDIENLQNFGMNFGTAFQITDDLMDVVSDESTMGKPKGQDILEGHLTLPLIRYFARNKSNIPPKKLSELTPNDKEFKKILEGLNQDGSLSYSYSKASEYINLASKYLEKLKQGPAIDLFQKMTDDLPSRMT